MVNRKKVRKKKITEKKQTLEDVEKKLWSCGGQTSS